MLFKFAAHFENVLTSRKLFEYPLLHPSPIARSLKQSLPGCSSSIYSSCVIINKKRCFISQLNGAHKIRAKCSFYLSIKTNAISLALVFM